MYFRILASKGSDARSRRTVPVVFNYSWDVMAQRNFYELPGQLSALTAKSFGDFNSTLAAWILKNLLRASVVNLALLHLCRYNSITKQIVHPSTLEWLCLHFVCFESSSPFQQSYLRVPFRFMKMILILINSQLFSHCWIFSLNGKGWIATRRMKRERRKANHKLTNCFLPLLEIDSFKRLHKCHSCVGNFQLTKVAQNTEKKFIAIRNISDFWVVETRKT